MVLVSLPFAVEILVASGVDNHMLEIWLQKSRDSWQVAEAVGNIHHTETHSPSVLENDNLQMEAAEGVAVAVA